MTWEAKMYNHKGLLIVISGFSGAGKGTVVKEMLKKYNYSLSVSATTREPRENEFDGIHYNFISKDEFEDKIRQNQFFEWAKYCNNYYGTPKEFVFQQLEKGQDIILEIEVQGALKIKEQFKDAILIFITAPSGEDLKNRLIGRGTESMDAIEKRLKRSCEEVDMMEKYDYIIVNEDVDQCADDIHQIIRSEHNRISHLPKTFYEQLRQEFQNLK